MKALKISKSPDDAIKDLLSSLFEKQKIKGVFSLCYDQDYFYGFVTDKNLLNKLTPTAPVMPANGGKMLSRLTMLEPIQTPIVVVLRPCELRALYELVKLEQANIENLIFISFICPGVLSLKEIKGNIEEKVANVNQKQGLRECCRFCENFVPENADLILPVIDGENNNKTTIFIKTERGEELLQGIENNLVEEDFDSATLSSIREERTRYKEKTWQNIKTENLGIPGLIDIFGRCINCHACGRACPICYCNLCYFDSASNDTGPRVYEEELERRGALRLPSGTIFYHIGRMIHISLSCVGCGMCSDVCPISIPVGTVFTKIAEATQGLFNYVPGRDLEEKIPISTFKIKEFDELGEA